ncbi:Hypothetical_protein [Hexamita inflata]|uniref:Hypothetical_protein n=1 Tax=Hexamita inflata TaxID=28002 RepID=A0AA86QEH5_9EUKA|nr:Hypothetical protein HINF_LOCUS44870 [Hexamita inflata]
MNQGYYKKLVVVRLYIINPYSDSLRIRGSNNWCTDAICNLQLIAQALDLQRTSVFIFDWVNLNDFRYLITNNSGGLFLSISTGLKMKSWYFSQLELQFRQLQSFSFSKYKK